MEDFFDANYKITDLNTRKGEIVGLEINNKKFYYAELDENVESDVSKNGVVEIKPSEGKVGMRKATVRVSVSQKLDDNVERSIDVQEYSSPIKIVPTSPNEGMKMATVSLRNTSPVLCGWSNGNKTLYTKGIPTESGEVRIFVDNHRSVLRGHTIYMDEIVETIEDVGIYEDGVIVYNEQEYERNPSKNIIV